MLCCSVMWRCGCDWAFGSSLWYPLMCHMVGRSFLVFSVFFLFQMQEGSAYCVQFERFTGVHPHNGAK